MSDRLDVSGRCDYRWSAPLLLSDGTLRRHVPQACVLSKGHDGDHQSWSKVTAPREEP